MDKRKIGKRIQEYRQKAHISQQSLAEAIGISPTSVSNMERGNYSPTIENFVRIANVLGITSDLLLQDVLDASYSIQTSELSKQMETLPVFQRRQVLGVLKSFMDTMPAYSPGE